MLKLIAATVAVLVGLGAAPAQAQIQSAGHIGEIRLFPYDKCPRDWIEAEGQVLAISRHAALFRLIGTRFGGDGSVSFNLPDLRAEVPSQGLRYCIALKGTYPNLR